MARIWMKTIKNHKIVENRTAPCEFETAPQVLGEMLREADIARPLWLDKHLKEWARFQRTLWRTCASTGWKSNFCPTTARYARARIRATRFEKSTGRTDVCAARVECAFINILHKNVYIVRENSQFFRTNSARAASP